MRTHRLKETRACKKIPCQVCLCTTLTIVDIHDCESVSECERSYISLPVAVPNQSWLPRCRSYNPTRLSRLFSLLPVLSLLISDESVIRDESQLVSNHVSVAMSQLGSRLSPP